MQLIDGCTRRSAAIPNGVLEALLDVSIVPICSHGTANTTACKLLED